MREIKMNKQLKTVWKFINT